MEELLKGKFSFLKSIPEKTDDIQLLVCSTCEYNISIFYMDHAPFFLLPTTI